MVCSIELMCLLYSGAANCTKEKNTKEMFCGLKCIVD